MIHHLRYAAWPLTAAALVASSAPGPDPLEALRIRLAERIARDSAEVGVAFMGNAPGDTLFIHGDQRFHAASTMKVPVLIELARRIDAGETGWDDSLVVRNHFTSIVDGSAYQLDPADEDLDKSLYSREGQAVPMRELARLMITQSSNLATNILIGRLDPGRVHATARRLGADSIQVLRGVQDIPAFERGLNNSTTARDLATLFRAIVSGRAASAAGTREILDLLLAQKFNDGIPAGLPPGTRVAHKTGEITATWHDAALVYPPGRPPFVLIILSSGIEQRERGMKLQADLASMVWSYVISQP